MLRVCMASGEEVASVPAEELSDVRSLKLRLEGICGQKRFQQKLLRDGEVMEDAARLETEMDLQLVLLPLVEPDREEGIAFLKAVVNGEVDQVETFLQRPYNANFSIEFEDCKEGEEPYAGPWGCPLIAAAEHGQLEIASLLVEAGAEIDKMGAEVNCYNTALATAAWSGHEAIVRFLIEKDADLDAEGMGVDGTTPLVAATYHRHPAIVRMLLDAGADIEKDADWFGTALYTAVRCGSLDIARMILEAGAKESKQNLKLPENSENEELKELLKEYGATIYQPEPEQA